jgi:hypothetical protein
MHHQEKIKVCIFCKGGLSGKKRGKEHILSQHMIDEFDIRKDIVGHSAFSSVKSGFNGGHMSVQSIERTPAFSSFLAGKVCAECNSGWMNNLETESRPYLYPLMKGHSKISELDRSMKSRISCWYFKTAVVLGKSTGLSKAIGNEQYTIPDSHCAYFYSEKGQKLPPGVSVFASMAQSSDFLWSICSTWAVTGIAFKELVVEQYKDAYKIFFQLDKLMLMVVYWPHNNRVYRYEEREITPIGGESLCIRKNEDLREFFKKDDERFIMGIEASICEQHKIEKVGRNEICPCGSGYKFKKCHEA